ncbi:hypothetical protein QEN19_002164 [Hanseniaspora menglaensis]
MAAEKEVVFLSGITGFIAQHIAKQLLESGQFKVIGSVRSEEKALILANNFGNNPDLSFVYVKDISDKNAFDESFEKYGSSFDYVIHTASPVTFEVADIQKDLITPAHQGSAGIFKAAVASCFKLKHFVITSSFAAIVDQATKNDPNTVYDETSWNPSSLEEGLSSEFNGYRYSKKIAEKTVWDLSKKLNTKFGITAVNPVFVFGPQCFDSAAKGKLNTSCEFIRDVVNSKLGDELSGMNGAAIDVRDVAKAHIMPLLESQKFNGKRLLLSDVRFDSQIFADILNDVPELKGKISIGNPNKNVNNFDNNAKIVNEETKKLLGFKFISLKKSVTDTAAQIIRAQNSF